MRCLSLFNQENGQLTPIIVEAPGGGFNPEFNAIFAQNLGFGPPPPGAQPMPPPQQQQQFGGPPPGFQQQQGPQGPQHNAGAGVFDMGGGQQLHVKINGKTPEGYLKDKASSMIWGWIIGGVILLLIVLIFGGVGIYIWANKDAPSPAAAAKASAAANWDGKTPFSCAGADVVAIANVTATAGVTASGACQLTLSNVNITAPVGITASGSAKVTMTGGSITASSNSVVATASANVNLAGTKVSGKAKQSGAAKVVGAPL